MSLVYPCGRPRGGCVALSFKLWGVLGLAVSEGVTNQSPETGINYANIHLAMGQMTRILFKKYLSWSSRCDSSSGRGQVGLGSVSTRSLPFPLAACRATNLPGSNFPSSCPPHHFLAETRAAHF